MSAEAAAAVRVWPVGAYTCKLTVRLPPAGDRPTFLPIEWAPRLPAPGSLPPALRDQYRAGRDRALASIARELGINALVVEL